MARGLARLVFLVVLAIIVALAVFSTPSSSPSSSRSSSWIQNYKPNWHLRQSDSGAKHVQTESNSGYRDKEQAAALKLMSAEEEHADKTAAALQPDIKAESPAERPAQPLRTTSATDPDLIPIDATEDLLAIGKGSHASKQSTLASTSDSALATSATPSLSSSSTTIRAGTASTGTSTSTAAPQPRTRGLVLAVPADEPANWVVQELSGWNTTLYNITSNARSTADNAPDTQQVQGKGGAALAYLTYLATNYDNLPDTVVFASMMPGSLPVEQPKSKDKDTARPEMRNVAAQLHSMNVSYIAATGYTSLRCSSTPGCEKDAEIRPLESQKDARLKWHNQVSHLWQELLGGAAAPKVPSKIASPAGSQFAASRAQVQVRSRDEYRAMRRAVLDSPLPDDELARVMQALWHVVFGKPAVNCPVEAECYCELYGRCEEGGFDVDA